MEAQQTQYFAKSMEDDFVLKTVEGEEKLPAQSIEDIVDSSTIDPNTYSFGHEKRLACTLLHTDYTKTYRDQGIIFTVQAAPDYVAPFDLSLLIQSDDIVTEYYKIENNLHIYYNHKLIHGFEAFIFDDYEKMFEEFPSPEIAWQKVNEFRMSQGYPELSEDKKRLVSYNEAVFLNPVKIEPLAVFGHSDLSKQKAQELGLAHFNSAQEFLNSRQ